jgi:hypothetical protein
MPPQTDFRKWLQQIWLHVINQTYIHPFSGDTIQTLYSLSLLLKCALASQLTFIELYGFDLDVTIAI